jgi:hypothetical protein
LLALLLGAFTPFAARAEAMRAIEGEVIAAYLNSLESGEHRSRTLVFASLTSTTEEAFIGSKPDAKEVAATLPEATSAVIDDFLRVAGTPSQLEIPPRLVRKSLKWRIAQEAALVRIFGAPALADAWKQFYQEYPNASGITRVSRVGIDEEAAQALFYLSITPAGLGGAGFFLLLHRRFGIWRVLASKSAWVS